jgi:two-component system phosphate regulon sensor histidine kinase PhoR
VRASGDELSDVLAVLLENAIRFSAPGSAVRVRAEAAAGHGILSVVDQGRGISPEDLPRVTLPFYQGKPTRGGHGLGLAIARAVVDRRRGRLEIASRPGEGTTVTARFPLLPASRRPPA